MAWQDQPLPVEFYKVRIYQNSGQYVDLQTQAPWLEFVRQINLCQGVLWEHAFIPLMTIKLVVRNPDNPNGVAGIDGGKVVPLFKDPLKT